ncbi:hypothetical protein BHM03_00045490 [Ensete ventricosum]|nr:hypothetical protein BHM03_00045490 [Ensete ventricosum]
MRLNYVESFYAFLLCFRSEGSEEEGWPATASPHAGSATHGQVVAKALQGGNRLRPGLARKGGRRRSRGQHPAGATAAHGHTCLHHDAHKGGRLQGAREGLPQAGLWRRRARAAAAYAGAAVVAATTQMEQEGLGHPFKKRTILPL